ncbi:EpsG family protein [Anaerostipes butyraticus]|uniref:EpsG family protein n=1 Tax=Anaerostipes butyraticus TaxID=645466 RepID=A0A916Q866_9FIRM|nr:EpsG family protein [Anaerostipes butyraticus]GFO86218.1 hypothetical protein ANBU17_25650 [Anaerostipes butyraticus]
MIFQWQLFVLLIVVGVLAGSANMIEGVNSFGQIETRYKLAPALFVAIPLIYLAGTRGDNIGDTYVYRESFLNMPSSISAIPGYITDDMRDKGFAVLSVVIKSIIGNKDVVYFTIIAAICILCVVLTYRKYSCNFIISVFLFIASGEYIQWTYNGIRQFIPVAILFACTGLILKKKYIPFIMLTLILSTIHASALLMIPMVFIVQGRAWNRKTMLLMIAVIIAIASLEQFTDLVTGIMENTQYSGEVDQYLSTEGTSLQRVLVYSIPAILSLVLKRRIDRENHPVINLAANMALITALTYLLSAFTSGIFLGRIPIYFSLYNYILLPWLIEHCFTKNSARLIYLVLIGCYLLFYYFQMHVTWNLG